MEQEKYRQQQCLEQDPKEFDEIYVSQLDNQFNHIDENGVMCENVYIGYIQNDKEHNYQVLNHQQDIFPNHNHIHNNNNQNLVSSHSGLHPFQQHQPHIDQDEMEQENIPDEECHINNNNYQQEDDEAADCDEDQEDADEDEDEYENENFIEVNQEDEEENKQQQIFNQNINNQSHQSNGFFLNNKNNNNIPQNNQNQCNQQYECQPSDNDENNQNGGVQQLRSPLPQHLNQIYYKRKNNIDNSQKDYDINKEPHMKLTLMKTNQSMDAQQVYIVTPKGLIDSQKNTDTEDIIIGRQQQTFFNDSKQEIHPNDIVLPANDRAISRIHCKIIYKHGFRVKRPIQEGFLQFLKLFHKNSNSYWKQFPEYLQKIICQFIQPERKFYIVDIGSVYGTYIRVKPIKPHIIEKGQVFLIGADTLFNIVEVCLGSGEFINNRKNSEFFNMLSNEMQEGTKIYGLKESEEGELNQLQVRKSDNFLNETQQFGVFNRPFIKIEIQNANHNLNPKHIFVADLYEHNKSEFKIGRSQECQIVINQNTISRKQSRIYFENGKWYLSDGDQMRESANGTWISLTDYYEKKNQNQQRAESDHKEIEHDTEIKISDSILKIQIFNNYNNNKNKSTYYNGENQIQQQQQIHQIGQFQSTKSIFN